LVPFLPVNELAQSLVERGIQVVSGAVNGAADYCIEKCGTSEFSWDGLATQTILGAGFGLTLAPRDLDRTFGEATGAFLEKVAPHIENEDLGAIVGGIGSAIAHADERSRVPNLVGSVPGGLAEGAITTIANWLIVPGLDQELKQLNGAA
jgi:hypothetical protein